MRISPTTEEIIIITVADLGFLCMGFVLYKGVHSNRVVDSAHWFILRNENPLRPVPWLQNLSFISPSLENLPNLYVNLEL